MNQALVTSLTGIAAAQLLKIPLSYLATSRMDFREALRAGGMPSSHTAGVVSLAAYIGCRKGLSSVPFALASVLSLIVMYDAMGVRRHAGLIAAEVNDLTEALGKLEKEKSLPRLHLEERLGHLPAEVAGGALLGLLVGWISSIIEDRVHA